LPVQEPMGALVGDFEISSEPGGALVGGFGCNCSCLIYRLTVPRSIPSSLAIRRIGEAVEAHGTRDYFNN